MFEDWFSFPTSDFFPRAEILLESGGREQQKKLASQWSSLGFLPWKESVDSTLSSYFPWQICWDFLKLIKNRVGNGGDKKKSLEKFVPGKSQVFVRNKLKD
jgi:hypothetical protein